MLDNGHMTQVNIDCFIYYDGILGKRVATISFTDFFKKKVRSKINFLCSIFLELSLADGLRVIWLSYSEGQIFLHFLKMLLTN